MNTQKTNLHQVSKEWATRPDDQRFTTLEDLEQSVKTRKSQSWTVATETKKLCVLPTEDEQDIQLHVHDVAEGRDKIINPTNFSFGQLAQYGSAPASYLRKLPAPLAAINLQYCLEQSPLRDDVLVLGQTNGKNSLRSMTSTTYGRIWDIQVVNSVKKANRNGQWKVPAASYSAKNPKRATTLYASDRDVFIFLVDPEHPIEINGEILFRGFITWNSEVGSSIFGLTTFLYRYVCDNRIIWGATDVKELKIRHTSGAPERFAQEGYKYLQRYANESTNQISDTIKKANDYELPQIDKETGGWESWLKSRGFTNMQAKQSVAKAVEEEGEARSLWNIVNGVTAYARQIAFTDERVDIEAKAGSLLNIVKN